MTDDELKARMLSDEMIAVLEQDRQSYAKTGVNGAANAIGMLLQERIALLAEVQRLRALCIDTASELSGLDYSSLPPPGQVIINEIIATLRESPQ